MSCYSLIFIIFIFINLIVKCQANCDSGWFGPNCKYKCHCLKSCDTNGECWNQRCENGWFGYKCQYEDFVSVIQATGIATIVNASIWTDNDDSTCIRNESLSQIIIHLKQNISSFYMMLVVGDSALYNKFTVTLGETSNDSSIQSVCGRQKFTAVENRTVAVRCEHNASADSIILSGEGVTSLCSIYVTRGFDTPTTEELIYKQSIVSRHDKKIFGGLVANAIVLDTTTEGVESNKNQSSVSAPSLGIGLGIGAGVVVLLVVVIVVLVVCRRKRNRRKHSERSKWTNQTHL